MLSRSLPALTLVAVAALIACKSDKAEKAPAQATRAVAEQPEAAQATAEATSPELASASGIAWIHNDYAAALKAAKAQNKALVIDMWAAWCHTCVAMQAGTLRDAGLANEANKFVWLAVDTEAPESAEAMARFQPQVWPTFYVVSPVDETVQATQLGSCSVPAFREFLTRGQHGHLAQLGDTLAPDSALHHLREGDQLWTQSKYLEASRAYGEALQAGGPSWPHAAATLNRQISALAKLEDKGECARLATREMVRMSKEHNASGADFMDYAGTCAAAFEASGEATQARRLRTAALAALDGIYADAEAALSLDDRSTVLASSRAIALALGQDEMALAYAQAQQLLLNHAVNTAPGPMEEMTYVWHQVEVHSFLEEGEKILPWVESLEERLPSEYDPPYRKAWLLFEMERYDEAHEALAPALRLAQAARKGRMLSLGADIHKAQGNWALERELRQAAVAHYQSLAEGQSSATSLAAAQEALQAMGDAPPAAAKVD